MSVGARVDEAITRELPVVPSPAPAPSMRQRPTTRPRPWTPPVSPSAGHSALIASVQAEEMALTRELPAVRPSQPTLPPHRSVTLVEGAAQSADMTVEAWNHAADAVAARNDVWMADDWLTDRTRKADERIASFHERWKNDNEHWDKVDERLAMRKKALTVNDAISRLEAGTAGPNTVVGLLVGEELENFRREVNAALPPAGNDAPTQSLPVVPALPVRTPA